MSFENSKDEFVGKAKEAAGKVSGDKSTEGEGLGEQLKAKASEAKDSASEKLQDAKEKVEGVFNGLKGDK
ncbi:MAG: CsbD family protein [Galactobacter sp.]|uniref:CsbD family protein n=1 Tax=Galactobacter sp. TaxID=2676125 RepID=UPI0025C4A300|nr:CsbD family protein [Galactobacter sp.]